MECAKFQVTLTRYRRFCCAVQVNLSPTAAVPTRQQSKLRVPRPCRTCRRRTVHLQMPHQAAPLQQCIALRSAKALAALHARLLRLTFWQIVAIGTVMCRDQRLCGWHVRVKLNTGVVHPQPQEPQPLFKIATLASVWVAV